MNIKTLQIIVPDLQYEYKLVNKSLSWYDAELYCQAAWRGHLVTIRSETENRRFSEYARKYNLSVWWIGLIDAQLSGDFRWRAPDKSKRQIFSTLIKTTCCLKFNLLS